MKLLNSARLRVKSIIFIKKLTQVSFSLDSSSALLSSSHSSSYSPESFTSYSMPLRSSCQQSNNHLGTTYCSDSDFEDVQLGSTGTLLDKLNEFGNDLVITVLSPYLGVFDKGGIFEGYEDPDADDLYYLPPEPDYYR